jgi:hypothetical protein
VIDNDAPTIGIPGTAVQRQPRYAGDRRQGFSTESEAGDAIQSVIGELRRRVPLESEMHFLGCHPAAVVSHLEELEPSRDKPDADRCGPCIQAILKKLLEGARWAFYDLASGDAIHELGRQPSY